MSKPWDSLRSEAPIKTGHFSLHSGAGVHVTQVNSKWITMGFGNSSSAPTTRDFTKTALLELAEFCQTAAKQLG